MNRWKKTFEEHAIHQTMKSIVDNSKMIKAASDNPIEIDEVNRFKTFTSCLDKAIKKINPAFFPLQHLTDFNNRLSNVNTYSSNYLSNKSMSEIQNANVHYDQIAQQTYYPILYPMANSGTVSKSVIAAVEKTSEDFVENISSKRMELQKQLDELEKNRIDFEQKLGALGNQIKEKSTLLDGQVVSWSQKFSDALEKGRDDYSKKRQEFEGEAEANLSDLIKNQKDELDKLRVDFISEISKIQDEVKQKNAAISELYNVTAGVAIGGGHKETVGDEKNQANFWRWLSIVFIIVSALCLGGAWIASFWKDGAIWSAIPVVGILLWGAAYTALQSSKHRNAEVRSRRFMLEMAAIDPYLSSLEKDEQDQLKVKLSEKFFGQPDCLDNPNILDEHAVGKITKTIGNNLLKPCAEIVKSVSGK